MQLLISGHFCLLRISSVIRAVLCLSFAVMIFSVFIQAQNSAPVARLITGAPIASLGSTRARRVTSAAPAPRMVYAHAASPASSMVTPVSDDIAALERQAFNLINNQRIQNGKAPLVWDEQLCQLAREHSANMARRGFFAHATPEGLETVDRVRAKGIRGWRAVGENIALNQGYEDPAAFAVERWMQSTKHRTNILYPTFNHSAIGIAKAADGTVYFTQEFMEVNQ
jgi:uncharacterized protein YkwD